VQRRADSQKFWAGAMQQLGEIKLTTLDVILTLAEPAF
jgi:hypothetical protein